MYLVLVILVIVATVIALCLTTKTLSKEVEGFDLGRDFYIHNYLQVPVQVIIKDQTLPDIKPQKSIGLTSEFVAENLRNCNSIRVNVRLPFGLVHYSNYHLNLEQDTTIKSLHIGMNTSRWVGATFDDKFIPGNAQQGRPWVNIHNRTNLPLQLNENILVPPHSTLQYTGRHHYGVALGTIFRDANKVLPTFKFDTPATDIYFGVVSDIQQPLFGGWQLSEEFDDDPQEPHHLLESGFMGGPAHGAIPYGYLPNRDSEYDRWGQKIDNSTSSAGQ